MLTWMRDAILQPAQGLTVTQLDYLHDSKANSIGAFCPSISRQSSIFTNYTPSRVENGTIGMS